MVIAHYGAFSLAYFGLMAVLVLSLTDAGMRPDLVALCSVVFTVSSKVSKIPISFVLDRIPPNWAMLVGCLVAGASIAALPRGDGFLSTAVLTATAGLGVSVNGLASKQAAADASDGIRSRSLLFSVVNISINVASAIASPVAILVLSSSGQETVFLMLGLLYALSGVLGGISLRVPARGQCRTSVWWHPYRDVFRIERLWPLLLVSAFGWFFYAQLFGSLPVILHQHFDPSALGLLIAVNAVTIIALQLPVSFALRRVFGERPAVWILVGLVLFGVAFGIAAVVPSLPGLLAMVLVFSLAEASFVPAVDVAIAGRVDSALRATAYAVLSLSTAAGEALGSAAGITMAARLGTDGEGSAFWGAASATAFLAVLVGGLASRSRTPDAAGRGSA
nr:MFS transporter [Clavibacter sp. VKM Ac-2872]